MELPENYAPEEQKIGDEARFAAAAGVPMPSAERLRLEILGDLDDKVRGIGWWKDHLDIHRRILIGDHLHGSTSSVIRNVAEAALHLSEYEAWREKFDSLHARLMTLPPQLLPGRAPELRARFPARTPRLDLIEKSSAMHCAGVFRAAASALDCMAAAVVGVEALPTAIFRADFNSLRGFLGRGANEERYRVLRERIESFVAAAGPPGWIEWTIEMRNMLVHRGRRMLFASFTPHSTGILDGTGTTEHLRTEVQEFLPRLPGCSEVQAMITGGLAGLLLAGEAVTTCRGVLRSTRKLLEACAEHLLATWIARRKDAGQIRQPAEQWKHILLKNPISFAGYSTETFKADELRLASEVERRFGAAGVLDRDRATVWGHVPPS